MAERSSTLERLAKINGASIPIGIVLAFIYLIMQALPLLGLVTPTYRQAPTEEMMRKQFNLELQASETHSAATGNARSIERIIDILERTDQRLARLEAKR